MARHHGRMPEPFQLRDQQLVAFVATSNAETARKFYRDTLGLALIAEQLPFALVFDANGVTIRDNNGREFKSGSLHGSWAGM